MILNSFVTAAYLTFPLIFSGIVHMICIKLDAFSFASVPLHAQLFGMNKTYRGFLVMAIATAIGVEICANFHIFPEHFLQAHFESVPRPWLGLVVGLSYAIAELPNSYMKRRLNIPPGKLPERHKLLFFAFDHLDSATGCVLAYALFLDLPAITLGIAWLMSPAIHTTINLALFYLGLRKERF